MLTLSTARYLLGVAEIATLAGAATLGAARLRARALPGFQGAPSWLATGVLALAILIGCAELLGVFGLFEPLPYLVAVSAAGVALRLLIAPGRGGDAPPAPDPGRWMRAAGLAFAAVAIAHFCIGVRLRLSTGMTGFDSTWYHGPFAAGFAQSGETFRVQFIAPQFLAWFYPQNSELLHGAGILAFSRDLLSPLLNLGWLVGCLTAAWCIGRPYGAGPLSMAASVLVLGSGVLADQAGEARNDLVAIFFLMAALAIAINAAAARRPGDGGSGAPLPGAIASGALAPGAVAVSGLAAGMAAGTKVNYLAAALALVIALALLAPRGRRGRHLALAGLSALAGCGFWYLRNLAHSGSPLPWLKDLGPLALPSPDQPIGGRRGAGVVSYLSDTSVWSDWFFPGFHQGLGLLWPAVLALAVAGLLLCLTRRAEPVLRAAAAVGVVAVLAWLIAPVSASGPDGEPLGFLSGLRYLAPALAIGLALLPLAPPMRARAPRWTLIGVFALLLGFVAASGEPWYSGYLGAAMAAGLAAVALAALLGSHWPGANRRVTLAAGAFALLLLVVAGARGQRTYLENRYADPGFSAPGLDAAFRWARDLAGARVATTATRQYPLWGTDLSNRVRFVGVHRPNAGFVSPEGCRAWRRTLNEGGYDYAVISRDRIERGRPVFPPQVAWTASDPATREVLRLPPTVVFRLNGPLDPASCP